MNRKGTWISMSYRARNDGMDIAGDPLGNQRSHSSKDGSHHCHADRIQQGKHL